MNLDDKTIAKLAQQLGVNPSEKKTAAKVKELERKSDDELVREILQVKEQLLGSNVPKEKQMEAVRSLMPLMNGQQKARLAKLIELLES